MKQVSSPEVATVMDANCRRALSPLGETVGSWLPSNASLLDRTIRNSNFDEFALRSPLSAE